MRGRLVAGLTVLGFLVSPATAWAATVAQWHMDETSGSTMVDSVGSNNGALSNVTVGLGGYSRTAYGFNGSSSYVKVPPSSSLNPGSQTISFTVHVDYTQTPPSGSTTDYDLVRKGVSGTSGGFYKLEIRPDNEAICRFVDSNGHDTRLHTGPKLNTGTWHTITCTKTSSQVTMTIDGTTYNTSAPTGSISNTAPLYLGAKPGTDYYNGRMDEVSINIG
jgi:Concanavalin A-like lectin/glucanases superfamily